LKMASGEDNSMVVTTSFIQDRSLGARKSYGW
jgi:hypothetical protein